MRRARSVVPTKVDLLMAKPTLMRRARRVEAPESGKRGVYLHLNQGVTAVLEAHSEKLALITISSCKPPLPYMKDLVL
jgi:hypothetical protein